MRLYPAAGAASFRSNKTEKDIVLGGGKLVVPLGVVMHMPITAVHHSEGTWEKAYDFVPERFLEVRCHCTPPSCCTKCPLMLWCQTIPYDETCGGATLRAGSCLASAEAATHGLRALAAAAPWSGRWLKLTWQVLVLLLFSIE